jgi:fatty acid desaturase
LANFTSSKCSSVARLTWPQRAGPTWIIALAILAGLGTLTWFHADLPGWLLFGAGGGLLAWYGSLQHEATHMQLAPWRALNDAPAILPLALWLPFPIYRASHRAHHDFAILTDPRRDPESFYVDQATWHRLPAPAKWLLLAHNTLLGRLVLGPPLVIGQFLVAEVRALLQGGRRHLAAWLWHLPAVAVVLVWVVGVCGIPLWAYVLLFVYPGTSLTLVRSFAEHKAANTARERTAVVEAGGFFSLLFLNNNLHYPHHERPNLPWHALPAYYRANRQRLLSENGGLLYRGGYLEIARRFLLRPIDSPAHPLH